MDSSTVRPSNIDYEGLTITYSGYNGRNDNWGEEDIRISGTLPRALTMKVFGYQSGFADVTYSWGHGQLGESCGGRTLILILAKRQQSAKAVAWRSTYPVRVSPPSGASQT